jgi:hypothetical protein
MTAGRHALIWDGRDGARQRAAPGVYYTLLTVGGAAGSCRILLVD